MDEYVVMRVLGHTIGMEILTTLSDVAEGYELNSAELNSMPVRALTEMNWALISFDNDLYSYYQETLRHANGINFIDRASWQGWSGLPGPNGGWNKPATPLWGDSIGEMSVKQVDGKTVLSYFNASTGNMEVRVAHDPTGLGTAPVTTVVFATDWPEPAESLPDPTENRLAQPYGGYISPGSTLDEVRIFISQWNNADPRARAPYRVIQFAVNPFKP